MVGEGFTSDVYQSVSYDYTMEADGETMDDTTATIMIQLGDSWYVFYTYIYWHLLFLRSMLLLRHSRIMEGVCDI